MKLKPIWVCNATPKVFNVIYWKSLAKQKKKYIYINIYIYKISFEINEITLFEIGH